MKNIKIKAALFFALILFFGVASFIFQKNSANLRAAIFDLKNFQFEISQILREKEESLFFEKFKKISGAENFFHEIENLRAIFDLNFQETPRGILVSFSGFESGNSLHPFFGFFEISQNQISKIIFARSPKIAILKSGDGFLKIENRDEMPLECGENWQSFQNGEKIFLSCAADQKFILQNQTAILEFSKNLNHENLTIQNSKHKFLLEI